MSENKKVGNFISMDRIKEVEKLELMRIENERRRLEAEKIEREQREAEEKRRARMKTETEIHLTIKDYLTNPYHKLLEIQFYYIDREKDFDFNTGREYDKDVEKLVNIYCDTNTIYINEFNEIILRTNPVGVFVGNASRETHKIFEMELPLGIITGVQIVEMKPKYEQMYINGFLFQYVKDDKKENVKAFILPEYIGDGKKVTDLTFFIMDRTIDKIKGDGIHISEYSSRYNYGFKIYPALPKEISREFLEKFSK